MKTAHEQALEYCKGICENECSSNAETCNKELGDCLPTYEQYNAFIAGYNAAQNIEGDFNFIKEILDDLKRNGCQAGGKAETMLKDWRNELNERLGGSSIVDNANELAINQVGEIDGIKVQCLAIPPGKDVYDICDECAFAGDICNEDCNSYKREDNTSVYFKKVE